MTIEPDRDVGASPDGTKEFRRQQIGVDEGCPGNPNVVAEIPRAKTAATRTNPSFDLFIGHLRHPFLLAVAPPCR